MDSEDIYALAKRVSRLERVVAELASREGISIPDLAGDASGFPSASQPSGFASEGAPSGFASDSPGTGSAEGDSTGFASVDAERDPELLELLRKGDTIRAIKRYRELTGSGLGEAKQAVEDTMARNRSLG